MVAHDEVLITKKLSMRLISEI